MEIRLQQELRVVEDVREVEFERRRVLETEDLRHARRHEDSQEEAARHAAQVERQAQDEAKERQEGHRVRQRAELDDGGCSRADELRLLQADLDEEQADAGRDGALERIRHGVRDALTPFRAGNIGEDQAGDERDGDGLLPGKPHLDTDGVGEESVDAHARRQDNRRISHKGHDQAADDGREDCRKDRELCRDTSVRQDDWIDDNDIRDREKGRDASQDLLLP